MDIGTIFFFLIIGFIVYKALIQPAIEADKERKAGFRSTWESGDLLDPKQKEPQSFAWHMHGYRWHDEWERWVPDIQSPRNERYWESRGFTWNKRRKRWTKQQSRYQK